MESVTTYGALCLIPVVVVIVMALATKRAFEPLLIATICAVLIYAKQDFFPEFVTLLQAELANPTMVWVILVCGIMASILLILEKSNAASAFAGMLERFAKTRVRALFATWIFGVCLFIDDYLNVLTVGNTMKKVTDEHKISRPMLSFVVASNAANTATLAPISTWGLFFASLLAAEGVVGYDGTTFSTYLQTIPFLFYCWISVFLVSPLAILSIIPPMGAMKKIEKTAKENGILRPEGSPAIEASDNEPVKNTRACAWDFIIPLFIIIGVTIVVRETLIGVLVALPVTLALYSLRKLSTLSQMMQDFWAGIGGMIEVFWYFAHGICL